MQQILLLPVNKIGIFERVNPGQAHTFKFPSDKRMVAEELKPGTSQGIWGYSEQGNQ